MSNFRKNNNNNERSNRGSKKRNNGKFADEKRRDESLAVVQSGYNLIKPLLSTKEFNRKEFRGQRLRWIETNLNYQAVQSTAAVVNFALPTAYGSNNGTRIGDSIHVQGLEINMMLQYESLVVIAPSMTRVIIVQSLSKTTNFTAAEILENGPTGVLDIASHIQPFANGHTFHILYDKIFCTNPYGSNGMIFERIKLKNPIVKLEFSQGTNALQSPGAFTMLLISDSAAAPHPSILFSGRMWYNTA